MEDETVTTRIVYKMDTDGQCVAFMPDLPAGMPSRHIVCYAHVGQHSAAALSYMDGLPDATPEQAAALRAELHAIGYRED